MGSLVVWVGTSTVPGRAYPGTVRYAAASWMPVWNAMAVSAACFIAALLPIQMDSSLARFGSWRPVSRSARWWSAYSVQLWNAPQAVPRSFSTPTAVS